MPYFRASLSRCGSFQFSNSETFKTHGFALSDFALSDDACNPFPQGACDGHGVDRRFVRRGRARRKRRLQPPPAPAIAPRCSASAPAKVLPPEINDTISKVVGTMEGAEKTLTAIKSVDTDLGRLRDEIDGVIAKTTQTADGLRPRLADIESQINRLGPAPAKDAPPEAPTAAAERTRLGGEASELSGAIKTLEITWWRARQAIDKITDIRLQLFVRSLTERMSSPLFPSLWSNIVRDWPAVSWRLNYNATDWAKSVGREMAECHADPGRGGVVCICCSKPLAFRLTRYRKPEAQPDANLFRTRRVGCVDRACQRAARRRDGVFPLRGVRLHRPALLPDSRAGRRRTAARGFDLRRGVVAAERDVRAAPARAPLGFLVEPRRTPHLPVAEISGSDLCRRYFLHGCWTDPLFPAVDQRRAVADRQPRLRGRADRAAADAVRSATKTAACAWCRAIIRAG